MGNLVSFLFVTVYDKYVLRFNSLSSVFSLRVKLGHEFIYFKNFLWISCLCLSPLCSCCALGKISGKVFLFLSISIFVNSISFMQNFQGHNLSRVSSLGSPSSPNTSQGLPLHTQPWLSGSQGKPPIPSPSFRQQMNSPSLQQRSHLPQQQHHPLPTASQQQHQGPLPTTSQQQHMSSVQHQQPSSSHQGHEHFGQQAQPSRVPQATPRQQNTRVQGPVNQKSSSLAAAQAAQPNTVQSAPQNRIASAEAEESCDRILSKRTIHELVNQVRHLGLVNLC